MEVLIALMFQARNSFLESEQNYVFPRFGRQGYSQSILFSDLSAEGESSLFKYTTLI